MIGVHPKALLEFEQLDAELKQTIRRQMAGYADPVAFYVEKLCEGIATIAAAFAPEPVIVRLSDFKSNEYANLIGGRATSRTRRTRCSASAAPRATSTRRSGRASSSNAARCAACATRWGSRT